VVQAAEPGEVLRRLDDLASSCDLLITDYAMPLVSGADLIRQAREQRPDLPAIIITGYAELESIARRPEDVQVLAKPFTSDQLRHAIALAVAPHRAADRAAAE
jgi:CheY-like chemotaxis protein